MKWKHDNDELETVLDGYLCMAWVTVKICDISGVCGLILAYNSKIYDA